MLTVEISMLHPQGLTTLAQIAPLALNVDPTAVTVSATSPPYKTMADLIQGHPGQSGQAQGLGHRSRRHLASGQPACSKT
jgi:hypothetical protein